VNPGRQPNRRSAGDVHPAGEPSKPRQPANRGRASRRRRSTKWTAPRGGYIDLEKFRYREWAPALRAAGLEHRRLYDCRHTFATWAIESGVPLWHLAQIMGASVVQIEDTYARWLKRTDDQLRTALDEYDAAAAVSR
jgi:integrase